MGEDEGQKKKWSGMSGSKHQEPAQAGGDLFLILNVYREVVWKKAWLETTDLLEHKQV